MSLEAMEWVWEHARARGVARLVLLAIADRAGREGTAYAGTTMLVRRTRAARSSVVAAVDKLTDTGELEIVPGLRGPRGETGYRLPLAATDARSLPDSGGYGGPAAGAPGTVPVRESDRRFSDPSGPDSGREGSEDRTPGGTDSGPPHQLEHNHQEPSSAAARASRTTAAAAESVPQDARPLIAALTGAGLDVTWRLRPAEWGAVLTAQQTWGRDALVRVAVERTAGRAVRSARYLLAIWRDAANFTAATIASEPFRPAPGTNVVPLRRPAASHASTLLAGLALLEGQEDAGG